MTASSDRAGRYVKQPTNYRAFIPAPLAPHPPIHLDVELVALLSQADQSLGRLDGITEILPNPNLFVAMYVRREAVFSSQIEGTQSTLEDVLAYELDPHRRDLPNDVEEVVNYVAALNYGIGRLESLPLSLRLIREIHERLLKGVRGSALAPGQFRTSQNWIGPQHAGLANASFVPPPPHELGAALANFEAYIRQEVGLPALIQCGLAHVQFETIHPFLDGNGRVGRLLIAFQLVCRGVLHRPLLYLSVFLKRNRAEYYDRLMAVRHSGDWEGWLRFFLRGVIETADEANTTARAIIRLREADRSRLQSLRSGPNELRLFDLLFQRPYLNAALVATELAVTDVTASRVLGKLEQAGILTETSGKLRNRAYRYAAYWELFEDRGEVPNTPGEALPDRTSSNARYDFL